jgi:serine/threonine protein kinase
MPQPFESPRQLMLVTDLRDGSLGALLKARGEKSFDAAKVKEIFEGVCRGVAHLHNKNIIHRDLKPGNYLYLYVIPNFFSKLKM